MICPKCGNTIAIKQTYCETCGIDVTVFRKFFKISNLHYNKGLEKANIRDLSGAVLMLQKSLEMNKRNTDARNLLGLVLFEMGETVAALSEWVVSKHFQPDKNDADHYMDLVQSNPTKLDAMNQAIKKYNIALDAVRQGNNDLAVIQLKKVVNLNPHFLRAIHLLSLLYLKDGDYEHARRLLTRAKKVDISNTTTFKYLTEINGGVTGDSYDGSGSPDERLPFGNMQIEPITRYREDKPNVLAWVNWFLGIAIGIAVTFLLIVPTAKNNIRSEYELQKRDYASELNVQIANISSKEQEITALKMQLKEKEDELAAAITSGFSPNFYDAYFEVIESYQAFLAKGNDADEDEILTMAEILYALKTEGYTSQAAITLLAAMKEALFPPAAEIAFTQGKKFFDNENDVQAALNLLLASYHYKPENELLLYYLGQTYQKLEQFEEASMYYNKLLDTYPDSSLQDDVRRKIDEMGAE